MAGLASPDTDSFSTPPTTPAGIPLFNTPSLSSLVRRSSRPSVLQLDGARSGPGVQIDSSTSPGSTFEHTNGSAQPNSASPDMLPTVRLTGPQAMETRSPRDLLRSDNIVQSPCFVHSHLDKGASTAEWIRTKQQLETPQLGVAQSLLSPHSALSNENGQHQEDDDISGGSLTEQLAETAVSVREMSKQLGRARVLASIQNVLIVTKARDNRLIKLTRQLALYLMLKKRHGQSRGLTVYVDNQLRYSKRFDAQGIAEQYPELLIPFPRRRSSSSTSLSSMSSSSTSHKDEGLAQQEGQLRYWTSDMCRHSPHLFDFVITLGGDGTVLFTSWLFQRIVPPVLPFALGSLGFLTNFDFGDHQAVMDSAIDSGIRVNLRMRFTCTVYRAVSHNKATQRKAVKKGETGEIMMKNVEKGGWEALEGGWSGLAATDGHKTCKDKEIMCFTTRPAETFEVINDLVVDRGPSPYVSLLELFGDEHHMTTVQADGLTVSTPTGSTAYSLSAGGSLVHPEIPALLITPICPHTLSFRPMLLPDTMELRICVPFNSRSTAWASFDGRGRVELKQGDHIKVTASKYPFPTVCADKQSTDWFHSISRTLKWNERERQKSFVVVEEGPSKEESRKRQSPISSGDEVLEDEEEDEVSDEDEEDNKFDINDSSPEAAEQQSSDSLAAQTRRLKSRSRSRSRDARRKPPGSGINTPGRYAGPHPHPPGLFSPKHIHFSPGHDGTLPLEPSSLAATNGNPQGNESTGRSQEHDFDALHSKMRAPYRDFEAENSKTPTVAYSKPRLHHHHHHHHHGDVSSPRAFAVWGQDESASDSDA